MISSLHNTIDLHNIVGLIGMGITVLAYFLMSLGIIQSGVPYQIMNMIGSSGLIYSLTEHYNISAMIMEIIWLGIGVVSVLKVYISSRNSKHGIK